MSCLLKYLVTTFLYITTSANFQVSLSPLVLTRRSLSSATHSSPSALLDQRLPKRQAYDGDYSLDYQQGTPRLLGTQSLATNINWDQLFTGAQVSASNDDGLDKQFEILQNEVSSIPSRGSAHELESVHVDKHDEPKITGKVEITQPSEDLTLHDIYEKTPIKISQQSGDLTLHDIYERTPIKVHKTKQDNIERIETKEDTKNICTNCNKLHKTVVKQADKGTPVVDANNRNILETVIDLLKENVTSPDPEESLVSSRASADTFIIQDNVETSRKTGNAPHESVTNAEIPASEKTMEFNILMHIIPLIQDKEPSEQILPKEDYVRKDPYVYESEDIDADLLLPSYQNEDVSSIPLVGRIQGIFSFLNVLRHQLINTFNFPASQSNQAQTPVYRRSGDNQVHEDSAEENEKSISDNDPRVGASNRFSLPSTRLGQSTNFLTEFEQNPQPHALFGTVLDLLNLLQHPGLYSRSASSGDGPWHTSSDSKNTFANALRSSNQFYNPISHSLENIVNARLLLNRAPRFSEHDEAIQDITNVLRSLNAPNQETIYRSLNPVTNPQEEFFPRSLLRGVISQLSDIQVQRHVKNNPFLEFQNKPNSPEDSPHPSSLPQTSPVNEVSGKCLLELLLNRQLHRPLEKIDYHGPPFLMSKRKREVSSPNEVTPNWLAKENNIKVDLTKPKLPLLGPFDLPKAARQEVIMTLSQGTKIKRNALLEFANKIVTDITEPVKSMIPEFRMKVPDLVSIKMEVPRSREIVSNSELARNGKIDLKELDEEIEQESKNTDNINSRVKIYPSDAGKFYLPLSLGNKKRSKRFLPSLNTKVSVSTDRNEGNVGTFLLLGPKKSLEPKISSQSQAQIPKELRFGIRTKRTLALNKQRFRRDCTPCQQQGYAGSYGSAGDQSYYGYTGDVTQNYAGYTVENGYGLNGEKVQIIDLNEDPNLLQPEIKEEPLGSELLTVLGDLIENFKDSKTIVEEPKGSEENTVQLEIEPDLKARKAETGVQQKNNAFVGITGEIINDNIGNVEAISSLEHTEDVIASSNVSENIKTDQNFEVSEEHLNNVSLTSEINSENTGIVEVEKQNLDLVGHSTIQTNSGVEINEQGEWTKNLEVTNQTENVEVTEQFGNIKVLGEEKGTDHSHNFHHTELLGVTGQISSANVMDNENNQIQTGILDADPQPLDPILFNSKLPNKASEKLGDNLQVNNHIEGLQVTGILPSLEVAEPQLIGSLEVAHQIGDLDLTDNRPSVKEKGEHEGTLGVTHHTGDLVLTGQVPKVDLSGGHESRIKFSLEHENKGNLPMVNGQGNMRVSQHANSLKATPRLKVTHNQQVYTVRNEVKPHTTSYFNILKGLLKFPFNLEMSVSPLGKVVVRGHTQDGDNNDIGKKVNLGNRGYNFEVGGNFRNGDYNLLPVNTGYDLLTKSNLGGRDNRDGLGRVIERQVNVMFPWL